MLPPAASRRILLPLLAAGVVLLLISVLLVGRDLRVARSQAETETVALAESSARAIQFAPAGEIEPYLTELLKHPSIEAATVYSASGRQTARSRPSGTESLFMSRLLPSLGEPVVGCKAVGAGSLCLTADSSYYRRRMAALVVPHAILLAASAILLLTAVILGRGSNRGQLAALARILRGASEENNYSLRAAADSGEIGEVSRAVNALLEQMQQRDVVLRRRTTELESANHELEAFSYAVSHDLRSPLSSIDGFSQALDDMYGDKLDDEGKECLRWIRDGVEQMKNLVGGLLQMSRMARAELNRAPVDLSELARSVAESLKQRDPARVVDFRIEPGMAVSGDERLLDAVLENLMSNAYKFTGKKEKAVIQVGSTTEGGRLTYFVKDNGAGFDSSQAAKMFTPFQRLHSSSEFEGTGIGLSTVKRIIERHGGAIWADGQVGEGATFYFTLGDAPAPGQPTAAGELSRVG